MLPIVLYLLLIGLAAWAGYLLLRRHYPASERAFRRDGPERSGRRPHRAAGGFAPLVDTDGAAVTPSLHGSGAGAASHLAGQGGEFGGGGDTGGWSGDTTADSGGGDGGGGDGGGGGD
jgi:hypothetical protein